MLNVQVREVGTNVVRQWPALPTSLIRAEWTTWVSLRTEEMNSKNPRFSPHKAPTESCRSTASGARGPWHLWSNSLRPYQRSLRLKFLVHPRWLYVAWQHPHRRDTLRLPRPANWLVGNLSYYFHANVIGSPFGYGTVHTSALFTSRIFSPSALSATANFSRLEELISFIAALTCRVASYENEWTIIQWVETTLWIHDSTCTAPFISCLDLYSDRAHVEQ